MEGSESVTLLEVKGSTFKLEKANFHVSGEHIRQQNQNTQKNPNLPTT